VTPRQHQIELRAKLLGDWIAWAVRAPASSWVALLFKDFEHHGMIGDFNDAKLLTAKGAADYFVTDIPGQTTPGTRKTQGIHT